MRYARVAVYVVLVAMFSGGLWLTEHRFDQSIDSIDAETRAREAQACETTLQARAEQEAMWVEVLRRAEVDEPTIDILRDGFASLPDPASC